MTERGVFDHCEIEVMEAGAAESVAPQRSEAALVGPSPAWNVDWNIEEGRVVRAQSEIVFAHGAAG